MSDIQEQIKLAHKRAEENDIKLLKEELEELREDNYAYHQLMKMQNEREYRSKFLKEFQEEFGKNVFPDYDEIYKRYDKLKKENKKLNNIIVIMEKYFELIVDLGYDYDGLNSIENLKGLIDELVRFASLGRVYNTTEAIYINEDKKYNILNEELKEK